MAIKLQVKDAHDRNIHTNWHGLHQGDAQLLKQLYEFLDEKKINYRTKQKWIRKTRGAMTGIKILDFIYVYSEENVNLIMLSLENFQFKVLE